MEHVTLTRFLCNGQRHLIREYAVTNRLSVGNTSMDAELALWVRFDVFLEEFRTKVLHTQW